VASASSVGWWYQLMPGAISILVIATTWVFDRKLKTMLRQFSERTSEERDFAKEVALDWSSRIGFHSALLGLCVSGLVAAADSGELWLILVVAVAFFVLAYLVPGAIWTTPLLDFREGGLLSKSNQLYAMLIIANLATMAVIALGPDVRRTQVYELVSQLWPG
jgi:hypothetical protein